MPKIKTPSDVFARLDMSSGPHECWWWTGGLSDKGVPYFQYEGQKKPAYVAAWEAVNGMMPKTNDKGEKLVLRHKCDNGPHKEGRRVCCNPRHLELGTHQDNMDDMKTRGRSAKTLFPGHIKAIREWAAMGLTQQYIADRLGTEFGLVVQRETVRDVLLGKNHEYVKENEHE